LCFLETMFHHINLVMFLWKTKCTHGFQFSFRADGGFCRTQRAAAEIFACEVRMHFMRGSNVKPSTDVISGILNCVCPECGGRMGERGREFQCQGECLTDWRQAWEQASGELGTRSKRPARRI